MCQSEAVYSLQSTLQHAPGFLLCIAYSPDGRNIATCGKGRNLQIWDVRTGALLHTLGKHSGSIRSVSWRSDGAVLVSGGDDAIIKMWDTTRGQQIGHDLQGHGAAVNAVAFSSDDKLIASGSGDLIRLHNTVRIWSAAASNCVLGPLDGHASCIRSVTFAGSRSPPVVASCSDDGTLLLWSAEDGSMLCKLGGAECQVSAMSFDRFGARLAVGSWDMKVRVWNLGAGGATAVTAAAAAGPARTLEGHTSSVSCVRFSPDGALLASAAWDRTVRIWNADTGRLATSPMAALRVGSGCVRSVCWSRGGGALASVGDDAVLRLWDPKAGTPLGAAECRPGQAAGEANTLARPAGWQEVWHVALAPDGNTAASADRAGAVMVWDVIGAAARLALAMAAHPRLGGASALSALDPSLLAAIANMTLPFE